MANIVQAEFFLVDVRGHSLERLAEECRERSQDGAPRKCTVRFSDNGLVTNFAKLLNWMKTVRNRQVEKGWSDLDPPRNLFDYLVWRCSGLLDDWLSGHKVAIVAGQLKRAIRARQMIAVETDDRHFREAGRDELHEILEAARKGSDVWLFVFKQNHLLADKNDMVARAMW